MEQNINLLHNLPYHTKDFFTAKHLAIAILAWIFLLLIIFGWGVINNQCKQATYHKLTTTNQRLQRDVAALGKVANTNIVNKLVTAAEANKKKLLQYLQDLTVCTPQDMWLTDLYLSDTTILLKGQATATSVIPEFAQALHNTQAFGHIVFHTMQINYVTDVVHFLFSTLKEAPTAQNTSTITTDLQKIQARFAHTYDIPELQKL